MSGRNAQCDPLREAAARFFDECGVMVPHAAMVVGVSGGADSVALLSVLNELSADPVRNWQITVAHLHHSLREDADEDAQFVRDLARRWDLPCVIERCDVPTASAQSGRGIEETARDLRYAFLRDAALRASASCLAVAHHANDNVETILHRIIRGTHIRGAGGIPAMRKLQGSDIWLVRPLLECRREQIEEYCNSRSLTWRTDATNADVRYRRNFIRHQLLPLLREQINPRVDEALLRFGAAAREIEEYLLTEATRLLGDAEQRSEPASMALDLHAMESAPPVIRKVAIRMGMEKLGVHFRAISADRFDELSALFEPNAPAVVTLPGNFIARREGDELIVAPAEPPAIGEPEPVVLQLPGYTDLGDGRKVACEIESYDA
ncbi:MAG: tRNA lysidine(34) synthetase TilS, partial [Planctomycetota bacterium]